VSVRTCTVICNCGPNGEPLRCGYKPGHAGDHSWSSLPTFFFMPVSPSGPLEIRRDMYPLCSGLRGAPCVTALPQWWEAVCASLKDVFPHVSSIRSALEDWEIALEVPEAEQERVRGRGLCSEEEA